MAKTNGTLKFRVEKLEKSVDELHSDMDELFRNHIPHLREEIHVNKWKIAALTAILTAIGGKLLDKVF